jgi:hypothetical protein
LYQWPAEHSDAIRRIFTLKGRGALKRALANLRDEGDRLKKKTLFMGEENWRKIKEKWKEPAWIAKSEAGKKAKTSEGGMGRAGYTGGSITTEEHRALEVYIYRSQFLIYIKL